MGRIYTGSVTAVAVTAAQDFFEIQAPSDSMFVLHKVFLGQYSDAADAQAELLPVNIVRYATGGSGGTTATPVPHNVGHAACGDTTIECNNTSQGTTPTVILSEVFNVQAGWYYEPPPESRIWVPASGILAIELPTAPADSLTMAGSITFEEID